MSTHSLPYYATKEEAIAKKKSIGPFRGVGSLKLPQEKGAINQMCNQQKMQYKSGYFRILWVTSTVPWGFGIKASEAVFKRRLELTRRVILLLLVIH